MAARAKFTEIVDRHIALGGDDVQACENGFRYRRDYVAVPQIPDSD
jgi:hypothetical protein